MTETAAKTFLGTMICLGFASFFGWFALQEPLIRRTLLTRGVQVQAVVTGHHEVQGRRSTWLEPVIEFRLANGQVHAAPLRTNREAQSYLRGQRLLIVYDPAPPHAARVSAELHEPIGTNAYLLGAAAGFFALLTLLGAVRLFRVTA